MKGVDVITVWLEVDPDGAMLVMSPEDEVDMLFPVVEVCAAAVDVWLAWVGSTVVWLEDVGPLFMVVWTDGCVVAALTAHVKKTSTAKMVKSLTEAILSYLYVWVMMPIWHNVTASPLVKLRMSRDKALGTSLSGWSLWRSYHHSSYTHFTFWEDFSRRKHPVVAVTQTY